MLPQGEQRRKQLAWGQQMEVSLGVNGQSLERVVAVDVGWLYL